MSDKKTMPVDESRRKFLETAGKAAAVAPAAGLLLAAGSAKAQEIDYPCPPGTVRNDAGQCVPNA
ncbi:MAG: hypothetical protein ABW088_05880 [Sedimenticola sp.]